MQVKISCPWLVSRPPKFGCFFLGKFTAEQVLKSYSDRKNSLKPPVFFYFQQASTWSGRIKRVESFDQMDFGLTGIQKCKTFYQKFIRRSFNLLSIIFPGLALQEIYPPHQKKEKFSFLAISVDCFLILPSKLMAH